MPILRICAAQYPAPAPISSHRVALFLSARNAASVGAAKAYRRHGHERHASRHARVKGGHAGAGSVERSDVRSRSLGVRLDFVRPTRREKKTRVFFSASAAATTARSPTPSSGNDAPASPDRSGSFSSSRARANSRAPSRRREWSTEANGLGSRRAFSTSARLSFEDGRHAFSAAARYAADASPFLPVPYASEGSHQPHARAWYATWNQASSKAAASAIAQRCVTRVSSPRRTGAFPDAARFPSPGRVAPFGPETDRDPSIAAAARANASSRCKPESFHSSGAFP